MTQLNSDALIAAAKEKTGLSEFGDPSFREGLDRLVASLNAEGGLNERGVGIVTGSIAATLANRLQVEDYLAKHPEIVEAPIEKPRFVFGLPRTGTTLAINLLAADPARRVFMRWEAFATVPPAETGALRSDERYHAEQAKLDMSLKYVPHISAMHHEDADSSTECQFLMSPTFVSQVYDSQYHVPSYGDWFLTQADYLPAFRYHKRLTQLVHSTNPGKATFKNPWHPLYLDALTTVYPDAELIMTHRDPVDVVASACSLVYHVRKMFSDDVDPKAVAFEQLRTFDLMIERTIAYEDKLGEGSIHHIDYRALVSDPIGEIKKVYARFDEPLTEEAETAMRAMLAANPQGKHGKHEYKLEDYGLTREGVREHFRDYCARYSISMKD